MPATEPSVYAALSAVMADVRAVGKDGFNTHQSYKFRGIDATVNAVGPALRAHNVIVVPDVLSVAYDSVTTTQNKPSTACRVHVAYTFYGPRGDSLRATVIGEAWDSGDKSAPKAMSVAFRTALLQALTLPTDDPDPDSETFERSTETAGPPQPSPEKWAELVAAIDACADDEAARELWRLYARQGIVHVPYAAEAGTTLAAKLQARIEAIKGALGEPAQETKGDTCSHCDGTGKGGPDRSYACGPCNGTGIVGGGK